MPRARTSTQQRQIASSSNHDDGLPLGQVTPDNLEVDLNYIRSVIRDLKGTPRYDDLVGVSLDAIDNALDDIYSQLSNASFHNATLTGTSTSETPPREDSSDRIATTGFVKDVLSELSAEDKYFRHVQNTSSDLWTIVHNLNKRPSVTTVNSANVLVEGKVTYIDDNSLTVEFSYSFSGEAYLS